MTEGRPAEEIIAFQEGFLVHLLIIILPVFLYGRETWLLTLREERRLRVFENRVLRRVFGPKEGRSNRGMEKIT